MKEIQIGDYIRTKKGLIAKVCAYQDLKTYDDKGIGVTFHSFDTDKGSIADIEIVKHSKNIIDLLEAGDYVNGEIVIEVHTDLGYVFTDKETELGTKTFCDYQVESIATHERFESIEYKI